MDRPDPQPGLSLAPPPLVTRDFVLLVGGHFLQALGYSSMVLLPLYLDWLGASRGMVGLVMAVAAVSGLLTRPFVGLALDRVGRKRTLVTGTVVLVVGVASIGLVTRIGIAVVVARLLIGVGTGVLFTGYFTLTADLVPEARRTEGIALFGVSGLVPLIINPVAGRLGLDAPDLRWFFPLIALLIATSLLFLWPIREAPRDPEVPPATPREALRALRARPLWPVWWATLIFGTLVYVFMSFVTVVAEAKGLEEPAMVWGTYALGAVGVRLLGARLPDRVGPSRILPPALLSYVAAFVLAALTETQGGYLLAGLLAGLGHGYCFPVLASQTFTRSPAPLRGSAMAAFTALWEVAFLAAVPVAGVVADGFGDRAMLLSVAVAAVAALLFWAGLERRYAPPI